MVEISFDVQRYGSERVRDGWDPGLDTMDSKGIIKTNPMEDTFHLLVSRREWGAREAKRVALMKHPVPKIRYTHTNTRECMTEKECLQAVQDIQRNHMHLGFNDVKYNFLIGGDGRAYEGRGWYFEGEMIKRIQDQVQTVDFGFIGNYLESGRSLIQEMTDVARGVIEWGIRHKMLAVPFDVEEYYDRDCE